MLLKTILGSLLISHLKVIRWTLMKSNLAKLCINFCFFDSLKLFLRLAKTLSSEKICTYTYFRFYLLKVAFLQTLLLCTLYIQVKLGWVNQFRINTLKNYAWYAIYPTWRQNRLKYTALFILARNLIHLLSGFYLSLFL